MNSDVVKGRHPNLAIAIVNRYVNSDVVKGRHPNLAIASVNRYVNSDVVKGKSGDSHYKKICE